MEEDTMPATRASSRILILTQAITKDLAEREWWRLYGQNMTDNDRHPALFDDNYWRHIDALKEATQKLYKEHKILPFVVDGYILGKTQEGKEEIEEMLTRLYRTRGITKEQIYCYLSVHDPNRLI